MIESIHDPSMSNDISRGPFIATGRIYRLRQRLTHNEIESDTRCKKASTLIAAFIITVHCPIPLSGTHDISADRTCMEAVVAGNSRRDWDEVDRSDHMELC